MEGTFAYDPDLGFDYGQSNDRGYDRPWYQQSGHEYVDAPPMQTRIWDYRKQWNRESRGDVYYEAFYRNDGRGDGYANAANRVPEYEARYWRPGRRFIPLDHGYLRNFNFELR